jgi:hypothetical protein
VAVTSGEEPLKNNLWRLTPEHMFGSIVPVAGGVVASADSWESREQAG